MEVSVTFIFMKNLEIHHITLPDKIMELEIRNQVTFEAKAIPWQTVPGTLDKICNPSYDGGKTFKSTL